jgi:undecaprenyl diphosphate synthase
MLMDLLVEMTRREIRNLNENNVRLTAIGDLEKLPPKTKAELKKGMEDTRGNTGLTLILAISYGGRSEIVNAARAFARDAAANPKLIDKLNEESFGKYLYTSGIPDPELIIRTGGDRRISNFLLWQAAYSELYITDTLWPDFDRTALASAIEDFNGRERRFGKVKE